MSYMKGTIRICRGVLKENSVLWSPTAEFVFFFPDSSYGSVQVVLAGKEVNVRTCGTHFSYIRTFRNFNCRNDTGCKLFWVLLVLACKLEGGPARKVSMGRGFELKFGILNLEPDLSNSFF